MSEVKFIGYLNGVVSLVGLATIFMGQIGVIGFLWFMCGLPLGLVFWLAAAIKAKNRKERNEVSQDLKGF